MAVVCKCYSGCRLCCYDQQLPFLLLNYYCRPVLHPECTDWPFSPFSLPFFDSSLHASEHWCLPSSPLGLSDLCEMECPVYTLWASLCHLIIQTLGEHSCTQCHCFLVYFLVVECTVHLPRYRKCCQMFANIQLISKPSVFSPSLPLALLKFFRISDTWPSRLSCTDFSSFSFCSPSFCIKVLLMHLAD